VDVVLSRRSSGFTCTTTSPLTEDSSHKVHQWKPTAVRRRQRSAKQASEARLEPMQ
jgi:hypothetical protein